MTARFYSFDTSAILNGRRDLFRPRVFLTLWAQIEGAITAGQIRSVDEVRRELSRRDDDAKRWADAQADLFVPLETPIQQSAAQILTVHARLVRQGGRRSALTQGHSASEIALRSIARQRPPARVGGAAVVPVRPPNISTAPSKSPTASPRIMRSPTSSTPTARRPASRWPRTTRAPRSAKRWAVAKPPDWGRMPAVSRRSARALRRAAPFLRHFGNACPPTMSHLGEGSDRLRVAVPSESVVPPCPSRSRCASVAAAPS